MNNYSVDGVGSIQGGEFGEFKVGGVGKNNGDISADRIVIEGVFTSNGEIKANSIDVSGVGNINGNIRSKRVSIEGVINMKNGNKLETESLYCEGYLNMTGELYADNVNVIGCIKANGIYGDQIEINSSHMLQTGFRRMLSKLNLASNMKSSKVGVIEATTINLVNIEVTTVNGHDITIGPNCIIDTVDCSGKLRVHDSSRVGKILGATEVVKEPVKF